MTPEGTIEVRKVVRGKRKKGVTNKEAKIVSYLSEPVIKN